MKYLLSLVIIFLCVGCWIWCKPDYRITTSPNEFVVQKNNPGSFTATIFNTTNESMKLVGVRSSCSCIKTILPAMPLTIPPKSSRNVIAFMERAGGSELSFYIEHNAVTHVEKFYLTGR